jgi:hypothetical protein
MRLGTPLLIVPLALLAAGCGESDVYMASVRRNVIQTPLNWADDARTCCRNYRLACEGWHHFQAGNPRGTYSYHYRTGFKEGYADYLENGGHGQPPAVVPYCYRSSWDQTHHAVENMEEWFAGFRQGAALAQASGLRERMIYPMSSPPINAVPLPLPVAGIQANPPGQRTSPDHGSSGPQLPPPEDLPPPKKVPPPVVPPEPMKSPQPRPPGEGPSLGRGPQDEWPAGPSWPALVL